VGEPLRIEVTATGGFVQVHLHGDVDLAAEQAVVGLITDLCEHRQPVVVDMSGVTFLDSTGVRILLVGQRTCTDAGVALSLRAVPPAVRTVLQLAGVDATFTISD
jgi:anti-anti-sigma factor